MNFLAAVEFRLHESIIRRSVMTFSVVLPGFLLNYLLLFGGSKILEPTFFGVFYTAVSVINTLFAPAVILGFFYSSEIARKKTQFGVCQAVCEFRDIFWFTLRIGAVGTAILMAFMLLGRSVLGVESLMLVILLPLVTYGNYLAESVRAGLQGLHKFFLLGLVGLSWMALRLVLGMIGLYLGGLVWTGVAGILLAPVPIFLGFYYLIVRGHPDLRPPASSYSVNLTRLFPFVIGLGLVSVLVNIDVFLAFLTLDRTELGIYAASAVLPKSMFVVLTPLAQVFFPILVSDQSVGVTRGIKLVKGFLLTVVLASAGAGGLIWWSDPVCHSFASIEACHTDLLAILALAAIPICLLRLLVLTQLSRGLYWHPLLLVVAVAAYLVQVFGSRQEVVAYAWSYLWFSWTTLGAYSIACIPWAFGRRRVADSSGLR